MNSPKNINKKSWGFVLLQLMLFLLYLKNFLTYPLDFPFWLRTTGLGVMLVGALLVLLAIMGLGHNLSPFPTPRQNGNLIQSGIFKFIRHPIYGGIILIAIGLGFYSSSISRHFIALLLLILFYFKARYEEQLLIEKFPEYDAYKQRTGMLFPKI